MNGKWLTLVLCLLLTGTAHPNPEPEPVRNLVLMIGDGMGLAQVSMLQIGNDYAPTAFDRAQQVALLVTRSANNRVTDSAAAATALATGCKTDNGTLGVDPSGVPLESSMARAAAKGLATGIVVTSALQHATPGAFYAHVGDRGDMPAITRQLAAADIDVLIGGGRRWLAEPCDDGGTWFDAFVRRGYFVTDDLAQTHSVGREKVLCAVAEKHLPKASERGDFLPRATERALELLDAASAGRPQGFLLLVEGSLIDYALHAGDVGWTLDEMRDFERAVAAAMDFADRTPGTLVVVTGDHETGGLAISANKTDFTLGENGLQYHFSTTSHTATMLPVYLYGTGADRIGGVMENTELARRIMTLLGVE